MIWGKIIIILSSFYFTYVHLEAKNYPGVFIFHFIILLLHILPSFDLESTYVHDLGRLFLFRPDADSGLEMGCFIVPLVLLSQMAFGKENKFILKDNWPIYHVAAIQMGLCTVFMLFMLKMSTSLTNLMVMPLICQAIISTGDIYWRTDMCTPLVMCLVLYFAIFFITMKLLPYSFTLGEAMVLSQTLAIFLSDFSISVFSRLHFVFHLSSGNDNLPFYRTDDTFILQTLLVGTLVTALLLLPVFYYINCLSDPLELWIGSFAFYAVLILSFIAIYLPSFYLTLHGISPFRWLYYFFYWKRRTKIYLILFWCIVVFVAVVTVAWKSHGDKGKSSDDRLPNIISRKIFHVLAVVIFVAGIIYEPSLLHLCSSVAAALFLFLEFVRYGRVKPLGDVLHRYLTPFVDKRDCGPLIFTHLYLLVGCSLPLWLYPLDYYKLTASGHEILLYAGVLSVGLGDAAASVVGVKFGKHRWKGTKKTWEGTAASVIVQLCAVFALSVSGAVRCKMFPVVVVIVLSSLLEAFTTQIDNFILPPFTYAMLAMTCSK